MSVLTLPPETTGIDPFDTVHGDLITTLRLHQKYPTSDGSTKHIAAALLEALTAQKEQLRAQCAPTSGSRPAQVK